MRYAITPVRPGLAAIAAVLALSATPSIAQEALTLDLPPPAVAPDNAAASGAGDSGPTIAPPQENATPILQQSTSDATTASTTAPIAAQPASPASSATTSTPVIALPAPATIVDAPPPPAARTMAQASPSRSAASGRATSAATSPVAQASPTNTGASTDAPATPPAPASASDDSVPAAAAAAAPQAATPVAANDDGDMLPIAGAAGAALLLLGGGIYAATRRRRTEGDLAVAAYETSSSEMAARPVAAAPVMAPPVIAPAMTRFSASAPMADSSLPAGFDLSRFGRHTQAAYRGPTPENPFLSLRRRLKRASFLDARERFAAAPVASSMARPQDVPAATTAPVRQAGLVTTKIRMPQRPGFRPAFQG